MKTFLTPFLLIIAMAAHSQRSGEGYIDVPVEPLRAILTAMASPTPSASLCMTAWAKK